MTRVMLTLDRHFTVEAAGQRLQVSYMRFFVDFMLVITHGRFRDCHAELIYLYPPWSYFGSCCSAHLTRV